MRSGWASPGNATGTTCTARPGNTFLVGGAVDQSFLFNLSLVLQVGSPPHGDAEAAPAAKEKPAKGAGEGGGSEGGGGDAGKTSGGADE